MLLAEGHCLYYGPAQHVSTPSAAAQHCRQGLSIEPTRHLACIAVTGALCMLLASGSHGIHKNNPFSHARRCSHGLTASACPSPLVCLSPTTSSTWPPGRRATPAAASAVGAYLVAVGELLAAPVLSGGIGTAMLAGALSAGAERLLALPLGSSDTSSAASECVVTQHCTGTAASSNSMSRP